MIMDPDDGIEELWRLDRSYRARTPRRGGKRKRRASVEDKDCVNLCVGGRHWICGLKSIWQPL